MIQLVAFLAATSLMLAPALVPMRPDPVVRERLGHEPRMLKNPRDAFALDLPSGCVVVPRNMKIDFEVFDVVCHGVQYVGIYAGNFPSKDIQGRIISTPYDWPAKLHVWADEVPDDQAAADAIAASVRVEGQ